MGRQHYPKIADDPALWQAYRETKDVAARNRLMVCYLPFVQAIAEHMATKIPPEVQLDELIAAGQDTLFRLFELFEPERGYRFTTYAMPRIKGGMLDYLREIDMVPRLTRSRARKLRAAKDILWGKLGREPTSDELRESMGLSVERFKIFTDDRLVSIHSIAEVCDDQNGTSWRDIPKIQPHAPATNLDDKIDGQAIIPMMLACGRFKLTDVLLIRLYYFEHETMGQIGAMFKNSESRISQRMGEVLDRLRFMLKAAA